MISSEWLSSFSFFAETLNFTHAATRLHISQPALHVQIRKLSEALGVALYVRSGRSLRLTEAGQRVLAYAREQREGSERLLAELSGAARTNVVVLTAGEGTFLYLLGPALRKFQLGKQGKLRVLTRVREQAIAAVQTGEAHLAVTIADEVPPSLVSRKLARVGASVVLPKGHRLTRKRRLSIADLRDEPVIAPPLGRPLRAALAHAWASVDATWTPAVEASGWELMMRFAALGMGVAIVNDFCTPPSGTVKRPLRGLPTLQYQLIRARDRRSSPAVDALEAAIVTSLRSQG